MVAMTIKLETTKKKNIKTKLKPKSKKTNDKHTVVKRNMQTDRKHL